MLSSGLHAMGAILIEGMNGCGKTSTARQLAASEVLLDSDPNAIRRAELDPRLLINCGTPSAVQPTIAGYPGNSFSRAQPHPGTTSPNTQAQVVSASSVCAP